MHKEISIFCYDIGKNKLLVQGAGGNVSWKANDILNVKASGTCLSDALDQDIFVAVDLKKIRNAFLKDHFNMQLKVLNQSLNKPSIETMLHALMPHTIVVHLHMVEVLAHILKTSFDFQEFLRDFSLSYKVIDYVQPGPCLAKTIYLLFKDQQYPDILFLKNHGVVIGGSDINDIKNKIAVIEKRFKTSADEIYKKKPADLNVPEYILLDDIEIQQIVFHDHLFSRLNSSWALYPDHIVFLGPHAYSFDNFDSFNQQPDRPEIFFVKNHGVYIKKDFSKTKEAQLRCYYDVIVRLKKNESLEILNQEEIFNLIDWDFEKYRLSISK